MPYDAAQSRKGSFVGFTNRKRSTGDAPSKEERKKALLEAMALPILGRRATLPTESAEPVTPLPATRRARTKYAV